MGTTNTRPIEDPTEKNLFGLDSHLSFEGEIAPTFRNQSVPLEVRAASLSWVFKATDLPWKNELNDEIPKEGGIYMIANRPAEAMIYHGKASGSQGLHGRLSNQRRWARQQRERTANAKTYEDYFHESFEVPAVRAMAHPDSELWIAVTSKASWNVPLNNGHYIPETPEHWEFLYAWSHLVAGHRSIIGGGAWEAKPGTMNFIMNQVAYTRFHDMCINDPDLLNIIPKMVQ
ncbi:hypothetical protein ACNPON_02555 [Glutamicibacter sp. AGC13]